MFALGHQLADNCAHDAWEAEEVERAWAVSKDTTTIAVLEEFVRRYGDSHYAALARARMEELRKSQAAAQTTVPPGFDAVSRPPGANGENITPAPAAPPLVPPQPSVAATIVPKRVKTVTIRTEVASQPTAAAPAGAYVVQASAQRTEAEAQSSYRALQQKYPAVLGSREANIRRVDLGDKGGIFYRAQVGSFATSEQAKAFCDDLKAAGGQCFVQRN